MAPLKTRRSVRGERGAELVEFAIITPLMLLMMASVVDFALLFHSYEVTANAAREGARLAMLPGYDAGGYATALARVDSYIAAGGAKGTYVKSASPVVVDLGGGVTGSGVRVGITYTHQFLFIGAFVGIFDGTFDDTLTYTTYSVMRTELQPPPAAP